MTPEPTVFPPSRMAKWLPMSKATGLSRESLYKTFKETAKPEFDTVRKVMNSLGVKLVVEPIDEQNVA